MRTLVGSLPQLDGEIRWGYGCQIGVYAQHVYTSLPETRTVYDYLTSLAATGTKEQQILDLAGAFLFKGEHVQKKIAVLSGGERARLCLAGMLLSQYNVMILDEPGNHLDVDTVDALAQALIDYKGTVIFTAHDRHFMHRVATNVIEVRDGRVTNYGGDYDAYLYAVNKEIDDEEREQAARRMSQPPPAMTSKQPGRPKGRNERELRKEISSLEKSIARLDDQKRDANAKLMQSSDPDEALRLHQEVEALSSQLAEAEERWCELQEELGEG